jgi:prepilin-type N-terminal cleavage/methylation domain-containing protein
MTRRRERGFTLLEVLSAMTHFALVAAEVVALATTTMLHTIQNRHASTAPQHAQQRLEDLRSLPFASIAGGTTTSTVSGQSYTVATSVQQNTPATGMARINVLVTWTGPEGARSYGIDTIYTAITS